MPEKKNTIGRFEILEKIGEGPIGAVYKALDPVIRRTVAIKVIKLYALEETTTFAEVFEKIYRVVRTSTSLNHPNICIIYDLSEEKKIPYITMEYVEGHDLDSLLQKNHQFKRAELLNVLIQVCDALDFAHKKNVIHQDLKTTNILLTADLQVKITDFGIAGLDEIAAAQTKKLLSIPYYISPEQALGEKVSASSDLFSLGVILYHLLSGELPFRGTTAANVIMTIARDQPAIPVDLEESGIRKDDWNAFFETALAKSPDHRFRSAGEMYNALQEMLPPSEHTYYPYGVPGALGENTGRFEKDLISEDISPPTVMIDPSKLFEDKEKSKTGGPEAPPPVDRPTVDTTAPVVFVPSPAASPVQEAPPHVPEERSLPETLVFRDRAADTIPPESAPTAMLSMPAQVVEQVSEPPEESYDTNPRMIPELLGGLPTSAPTQLIQIPEDVEPLMPEMAEPEMNPELPEIPELPQILEQPRTQLLTQIPALQPEFPDVDGLGSTVTTQPAESPEPESFEAPATVMVPVPQAPATIISAPIPEPPPAAATVITTMPDLPQAAVQPSMAPATIISAPFELAPAPLQPSAPPPPPVVSAPPPAPAEPPPAAPTVMMTSPVRPAPAEPPPAAPTVMMTSPVRPAPAEPPPAAPTVMMTSPVPPAPAVPPPAAPTVMMTSPPIPKPAEAQRAQIPVSKIVGPPNLRRYLIGAIVIAVLVALAGTIFFFWPGEKDKQVNQQQTTTTTTAPVGTSTTSAPPSNQLPGTRKLSITSDPVGAKVFLQGEEKGVTPLELSDLAFGKYALKLQMEGFKDVEQEIEVTAETSSANIPVTLEKSAPVVGTLVVESDPPNAFIVIGNRVLGVTPKKLPNTKAGKYNITLKRDGYQDFTGTVRVAQDKTITFTGQLVEIPKPAPIVEQPVVKTPEVVPGTLVTLGPGITPPKAVKKSYAKYPDSLRKRRVQGTIQMSVLVSETGKVLDVKILKSAHPILDEVSVSAVREWIFEPATKEGVPVKIWIPVSITYQIK